METLHEKLVGQRDDLKREVFPTKPINDQS